MAFSTIKKEILRALNENGISTPTGIQNKTIPKIMSGRDVVGISKTGSGKTVAFVLPMLDRLKPERAVQNLIICPTRELAVQIANEIKKFGRYVNAHVATVYGGASMGVQIDEIRRANIVVGTPGRLLDHLMRRTLNLSNVSCLVLDEADKMADMGFMDDIKRILSHIPGNRQTLLFGATISDEINWLKSKYMADPEVVKDEEHVKAEVLEQYYHNVDHHEKFSLLVHLLKKENMTKVIIFCSARSTVEIITKNLRKNGINADMIHGKLSQPRRLRVIENFNDGQFEVLVASSVAARGLDIKEVSHVVNYDLSRDPQEYVHRIGRTARAGEKGKAITLLSHRDHDAFGQILRKYDLKITCLPHEPFEKVSFFAKEHQPHRGYGDRNRGQEERPQRRWGGGHGRPPPRREHHMPTFR